MGFLLDICIGLLPVVVLVSLIRLLGSSLSPRFAAVSAGVHAALLLYAYLRMGLEPAHAVVLAGLTGFISWGLLVRFATGKQKTELN